MLIKLLTKLGLIKSEKRMERRGAPNPNYRLPVPPPMPPTKPPRKYIDLTIEVSADDLNSVDEFLKTTMDEFLEMAEITSKSHPGIKTKWVVKIR